MTDAAAPLPDPGADVGQQVAFDRLKSLYQLVTLPLQVAAAYLLIVFVLLWQQVPTVLLLGWAGCKLAVIVLRLFDAAGFQREVRAAPGILDAARQRHWLRRYLVLNVLDSLGWGLLAPLLLPHVQDMLLAVTLFAGPVAVASVGVFITFSDIRASTGYVLGALMPSALHFIGRGSLDAVLVGVSMLLYQAVLAHECWRSERRLAELLRLRYENAAIAEQRRQALALAEQSNAAKTRFLAAVSHEMRTPLNGIMGMTQLMQADAQQPEQGRRLAVVQQSAQHLQTVIGDLLDLSRIEFGRLQLTPAPYAPRAMVQEVTELLRTVASAKGLAFRLDVADDLPAFVHGDAARMRQVLLNLLGNAIKFTARGEVALAVRWSPAQGLAFTVSDSGNGVAPEDAERIFDAFAQVGPSEQRRSGVGLGLTISRELARAMGGDVVCEARQGSGAVFRFTAAAQALADAEIAALQAVPAPSVEGLQLQGRVLVVDDSDVNALVATAMLSRLGLSVETAADGEHALRRLQAEAYDLVLMDCEMPRLGGLEATRRWRQQEGARPARRLPIIALTANAVLGDRERCLAAGMDDYLAKPFDFGVLGALLRRHLPAPAAETREPAQALSGAAR